MHFWRKYYGFLWKFLRVAMYFSMVLSNTEIRGSGTDIVIYKFQNRYLLLTVFRNNLPIGLNILIISI